MILQDDMIFMNSGEAKTIDEIPKGNWLVKYNSQKDEYFLERIADFTLPSKTYGDLEYLSKRYLKTFNKYNKNLGVSLSGMKGNGKSLTAKSICINSGLAVIIIDTPYAGTTFNLFIESIKQKCIVFTDEFEKVYSDQKRQEAMLTLLDGSFKGNKLFLFTSNSISKYNNYLINRLGRIHYMKKFTKVSPDIINEIIDDQLINKDNKEGIINIMRIVEDSNIDMLFCLIREMNDFNETAKESASYLNISVSGNTSYKIEAVDINGIFYFGSTNTNPFLSGEISFYLEADIDKYKKMSKKTLNEKSISHYENNSKYIDENISDCKVTVDDSESILIKTDEMEIKLIKNTPYSYTF